MSEDQASQTAQLNLETGRLSWKELERHFARGAVLLVAENLDLVDVARNFVNDDRVAVAAWLDSGDVRQPEMPDAASWHQNQTEFWAIVAAPYVLIQIER